MAESWGGTAVEAVKKWGLKGRFRRSFNTRDGGQELRWLGEESDRGCLVVGLEEVGKGLHDKDTTGMFSGNEQ